MQTVADEILLKKQDPTSAQGSKPAPRGYAAVRMDLNGGLYVVNDADSGDATEYVKHSLDEQSPSSSSSSSSG